MLIIAIDLGTYSVKFLTSKIERKIFTHQTLREVVIDYSDLDKDLDHPIWDMQFKIIQNYLKDIQSEYRLIINAPSELFTDRFTTVPVSNKKKALMMIPFSLEEELPFPPSMAHMGMSLTVHKNKTDALVNICKKDDFLPFYDLMLQHDVKPKVLTTELSLYEHYISNIAGPMPTRFCIIDIGHSNTHAYFFKDKKLVSSHTSFIGGKTISESIASNYNINEDEANIYKHQNCFFLTNDKIDQVDEDQKKFALLMDHTIAPLISEIRRWDLGFRIDNGISVSEFFITGGSSNIKNIQNYLSQELSKSVSFLDTFKNIDISNIDKDDKHLRKFTLNNLEVQTYPQKSKLINLLSGDFSIKGEMDLPLHSFVYLATRIASVTALFMLIMLIENIFISQEISNLNKQLSALTKNPILELTNREKRLTNSNPKLIHSKLKNKIRLIKQEVSTLQSSMDINALYPLEKLIQSISTSSAEIIDFNGSSMGSFSAIIKSDNVKALEDLKVNIESADFKDLNIEINESAKSITINASI